MSSARTCSSAARVACVNAFTAGGGKSSGAARNSASFCAMISASVIDKSGGLVDRRRRVRARHRPGERVGERTVDAARRGQMVERLRLVEAPHLHRPFHRLAVAADGERAVFLARDRHRAAINRRRIRSIDLDLGRAGGLALLKRRIIEERKAHGALDLEGAVAGQKDQCCMGVDSLDRHAAMGCGSPRKSITACCEVPAGLIACPRVAATIDRTNNAGLIQINTSLGRMRS